MFLSKEAYEKIKKRYDTLLIMDDDAEDAFSFVCDVLRAERKAVLLKCEYATNTLERLEQAEATVWSTMHECMAGGFNEQSL